MLFRSDLPFKAFATFELQGIERLNHGRPLISDVGRRQVLHGGLLEGACTDRLLQLIETKFLADAKLNEHQHGAVQ